MDFKQFKMAYYRSKPSNIYITKNCQPTDIEALHTFFPNKAVPVKLQNAIAKSTIGLIVFLFAVTSITNAQTGAGTFSYMMSPTTISSGTSLSQTSETLVIGPNANITIDGTLNFYGKYLWISPTAKIRTRGSGRFIINNPDDNPNFAAMTGATTIDGNNNQYPIEAVIYHQNPNNIILGHINNPVFGGPLAGSPGAALNIGNSFNFGINGGDVLLNGYDLIIHYYESYVGALIGYNSNRMVVTGNSITGHLVQINNGNSRVTDFPVGIAEGDYTPARIVGSNDYHVSVTDYSVATAISTPNHAIIASPQKGINRAWHIYGGGGTTIRLTHNLPTNGILYTDNQGFITCYQGIGHWSSSTPEQVAPGVHSSSSSAALIPILAADAGVWLTKSSDAASPLPVTFGAVTATYKKSHLTVSWNTLTEKNNAGFEIEVSADGIEFQKTGQAVLTKARDGNSDLEIKYNFSQQFDTKTMAAAGLVFILLLPAFSKRGKPGKYIACFALALLAFFYSCNKKDTLNISADTDLFVRVKQIDKNGGTQYSPVVKAIQ